MLVNGNQEKFWIIGIRCLLLEMESGETGGVLRGTKDPVLMTHPSKRFQAQGCGLLLVSQRAMESLLLAQG